jgi:uncharacterized protein YjbI with pentapeptide repeats
MPSAHVDDPFDSMSPPSVMAQDAPDSDELRHLISSLNSAADSARTAWLSWLAAAAFLFVTVGSVTHQELLLDAPIKLPLLGVEIPLAGFFSVTPLLIVFMHFGLMMQQAIMGSKAAALNEALKDWEADEKRAHPLRHEIHSHFSAQLLAGTPTRGLLPVFWRLVGLTTFVLMPLSLLLFIQIAFLPFHDSNITWLQRLCVMSDLTIVIVFYILSHFPDSAAWTGLVSHLKAWHLRGTIIATSSPLILFFSVFVATIPGELVDRIASSLSWSVTVPYQGEKSDRVAFWPTAYLFEGEVNHVTGKAGSIFSRNLVLTDTKLKSNRERTIDNDQLILRGRDFQFGTFDRSSFAKADLTGSNFAGARLVNSDLSTAVMNCARPDNKTLERLESEPVPSGPQWMSERDRLLAKHRPGCTDFTRADLTAASLVGAKLVGAKLSGATLVSADVSAANLFYALLDGANLANSNLSGSNLTLTTLNNARLTGARLDGAVLISAKMIGAQLGDASLIGADLRHSQLIAANLNWAQLIGADLGGADLRATTMIAASLIGANVTSGVEVGHSFQGYLPGYQAALDSPWSSRSKLGLLDLRRARIWQVLAPTPFDSKDKSLDLIDGTEANFEALTELELKSLDDTLASIKLPTLRDTLRSKLRPLIAAVAVGEIAHATEWKKLFDANRALELQNGTAQRTEEIGKLVCDDAKSIAVLEGVLARTEEYWYDSDDHRQDNEDERLNDSRMRGPNFDPRSLHQQIVEGPCLAGTAVPLHLKLRLKDVVEKYERFMTKGTFQEGDSVTLIRIVPKSVSAVGRQPHEYGGRWGGILIRSTTPASLPNPFN